MKKNNPFGYKVGYRENGNRLFTRHFITYTYKQARFSLRFYRKYPQRDRETNRPIVDPFWEIKPITKKEYLAGIWDELPFMRLSLFFYASKKLSLRIFPFVGLSSHRTNANVNGPAKNYPNFSCSR